ncbi:uncharacterized protein [Haliotis cracherodii]|uniref:uncharacterized protein n=1 Tax=Haliotis cracherodii TaxID=6455 RepID=UPI0039EA964E
MTGATPTNYKQKLRRPEPRLNLTSLLKTQESPLPASPSLTIPAPTSSTATTSSTASTSTASTYRTTPLPAPSPSSSSASTASPSAAEPPSHTMATPHIKLRPYTGQEEATSWWQEFVTFVKLFNYNQDRQCLLFPFYLEGTAKLWHQDLAEETRNDMGRLEEAFKSRFNRPKTFDVNLLQMAQSKEETINDFLTRIQGATRNQELPMSMIVAVAVNGLRPSIRQWVINKEPASLEAVRHHAELAERSQLGLRSPEVNMAMKVDQLSELVATLITKTDAPAVQAAGTPATKHQLQQEQQLQFQPPRHEPFQPRRNRFHGPHYQMSSPPSQQFSQQQSQLTQRNPGPQHYNGANRQQRRPQYPVPPYLQRKCIGCGSSWSLIILWLMALFARPTLGTSPVQRLNYGIVFKPTTQVHFATEYWVHTYEVKLPHVPSIPTMSGCHQGNGTCAILHQIQMHLNVIKTRCVSLLNETRHQIIKLIPESKVPSSSRSKRAVLSFVGSLSKTLFGTATTDDVNLLAKHINALTKHDINLSNVLKQHSSHLSSFMKLVDNRFKNALKGVKANHDALTFTATAIQNNARNVQATFASLTSILIDQIQNSNTVEHQLEELKLGILDLAKNKLSPLLIAPQILEQTIHHIASILSNKYPNFRLLQTNPTYYYSQAKFIFARTKAHVYVSVKFPLSSLPKPFQMYKVISLPVPVNDTSSHSTQLLDIPPYFALSLDSRHFLSMDSSTLAPCSGDEFVLHCPIRIALQSSPKPSCSLALFQNSKSLVKSLCDFRYVTKPQPPQLISIDTSNVLVYRIPFLTLTCPGTHRMIPGCNFCLIATPCYCSLSTEDLYYPAPFGSCRTSQHQISHLHPVNLALLQHFFEDSTLSSIAGDTTFRKAVNFTIPKFDIFSHEISNILANDQKSHLSLKRVAERARKDQTIFQSITEPLLDGQITLPSSWPDTNAIIAITASAMSVLSIILVVWMFFKVRALSAALLLVTRVAPVKAVQPPVLNYNSQTTSSPSFVVSDLADYHVSILLGVITLAVASILLLLIYERNRRTHNGLVLELTTGPECVSLPILALSLCPSYWDIQPPYTVEQLRISGYFFPTLTVEWPAFTVTNLLTKTSLSVTNTLRVSFFTARKLQKMFNQPFAAYILMVHDGRYQILDPSCMLKVF